MGKSLSSEGSKKRQAASVSALRSSNGTCGETGLFMAQRTTMKSFFCTVKSQKGGGLGKTRSLNTTLVNERQPSNKNTPHQPFYPSMETLPSIEQSIPHDNSSTAATPVSARTSHYPRALKRQKISLKLKQMYLDLGQRDFGKQTICTTCGMLCVHGLSEDAKEHRKTCRDYLQGVTFSVKNARVVARGKQGVVVEVRPSDCYELRQKVKCVESIVDSDLGFVPTMENDSEKTAYLFIRNKKVLGMATAENITKAFVLESRSERSAESVKAMVGIHKIWVHQRCRKEGIASMLVDTVRSKFVFGLVVPAQMVAFTSPTVAGMGFAGHYVGSVSGEREAKILVYDCSYPS